MKSLLFLCARSRNIRQHHSQPYLFRHFVSTIDALVRSLRPKRAAPLPTMPLSSHFVQSAPAHANRTIKYQYQESTKQPTYKITSRTRPYARCCMHRISNCSKKLHNSNHARACICAYAYAYAYACAKCKVQSHAQGPHNNARHVIQLRKN